jgi:hypothetical protein
MASVVCPQCIVLSGQLCELKAFATARDEETRILRAAQMECAHMAEEVKQLHLCVEEQRRVLQSQSSKPKDAGVGIFEWMSLVAKQQRERELALHESWETRLRALSAELSHALEGQTRTASLESELSQLRALYDEEVKKTNALQVCVMEQYRHLKSMEEAGGELHPDIGLATLSSLLGATVLTKPEESTALEANLAALAEELATVKTAAKAKDEALEALEARCTELQETLDATKEKELNASLAARAATAKVNELSDLLKLNSQRMQAELQRTSSDCMNAMKARDALQVRVYENLTQLQIAEARVRDLERATTTAQPLVQFARDVQALVLGLDASKSVDAEGSLPVQLAATSPSGKKKKGKK